MVGWHHDEVAEMQGLGQGDSVLFRVKDGGLVHLWYLKWLNTETVVLQKEQDSLMLLLSWAASVWGSSGSVLELGNQ